MRIYIQSHFNCVICLPNFLTFSHARIKHLVMINRFVRVHRKSLVPVIRLVKLKYPWIRSRRSRSRPSQSISTRLAPYPALIRFPQPTISKACFRFSKHVRNTTGQWSGVTVPFSAPHTCLRFSLCAREKSTLYDVNSSLKFQTLWNKPILIWIAVMRVNGQKARDSAYDCLSYLYFLDISL